MVSLNNVRFSGFFYTEYTEYIFLFVLKWRVLCIKDWINEIQVESICWKMYTPELLEETEKDTIFRVNSCLEKFGDWERSRHAVYSVGSIDFYEYIFFFFFEP